MVHRSILVLGPCLQRWDTRHGFISNCVHLENCTRSLEQDMPSDAMYSAEKENFYYYMGFVRRNLVNLKVSMGRDCFGSSYVAKM